MLREYHKWHSPSLNRDMELLLFGHAGARVIVFPTSMGRFFDWENRHMMDTLSRHLENGWIQIYCVDSVDSESWYNDHVDPTTKAARHLQYQDYIINEVMPFTVSKNQNPFAMAVGASFGAYQAMSIAVRFPEYFNRVIAMSGLFDLRGWTQGYESEPIFLTNPYEYVRWLNDDHKLEKIKELDIIIPIGKEDQSFASSENFSKMLWERNIWHAFRPWDGYAHDWPYWQEMLLNYIGGVDSHSSAA